MVMTNERDEQGLWIPGIESFQETAPPSATEIMDLLKQSKMYFQAFHAQCRTGDDYFYGRNQIDVAEGFDQIRMAKARSIVNVATDHVDVNNVDIEVPLASQRAKARAEKLQKFYQGVWMNIDQPVKRTTVRHAFAYGVAWMKVMFDTDRWPDAPQMGDFASDEDYKEALEDFMEKRNISFPIIVENVNPKRLVWDASKIGPRAAIEFYERSDTRALMNKFPQWSGETDRQGIVQWAEYWDEKYAVFMANNEVVWADEHGYGFMPYVPVQPANTMDWDDGPPHERYQGMLIPILDLLDEHARAFNARSAILRAYAWPSIDFHGPDHLTDRARQNYEMFGGLNQVPAGVDIRVSPRPMPPPELVAHVNDVASEMEEATFPNVVRGVRPRGVSTGFALSTLAGMGRLVFQGVADGMARGIERCNSRFAMLVENKIKGRITVHARSEVHNFDTTIAPNDVRGYYENIVRLKDESPEEREREASLAFRLWNGGDGIIDITEAQKRSGVVNPLEMQVNQAAERLQRSPQIEEALQKLAAERLQLLEQLSEAVGAPGETEGQGGLGNMFMPGQAQLQRPGEGQIQQQRVNTNMEAGVFPQGLGGIDNLGALLGAAPGGAVGMPSGQTVR